MTLPRRPLVLLAALLLLLAGAHTGYWYWARGLVEEGLHRWVAQQRRAGWEVAHGPPRWAGWPLAAQVRLRDVRLAAGPRAIPAGLVWTSSAVRVGVDLMRPDILLIEPEGNQTIRLQGRSDLSGTATALRLALPLQPGPQGWGEFTLRDLRADVRLPERPATRLALAALRLRVDIRAAVASGEPTATLSLAAGPLHLPDGGPPPLGPEIAALAAEARLFGPLPPPFLSPAAAARFWRAGGGVLEVGELRLRWDRSELIAQGRVMLDRILQPAGEARAELRAGGRFLDAAARAGLLPPREAISAAGLLALLGGGEDGTARLDLGLREGTLSLRQMPLLRLRLPPVAWPQ